ASAVAGCLRQEIRSAAEGKAEAKSAIDQLRSWTYTLEPPPPNPPATPPTAGKIVDIPESVIEMREKTGRTDGRSAEASGTTVSPTDRALRALPHAIHELVEYLTPRCFRHLASEEWSRLEALDRQVAGLVRVAGLTSTLPPRGPGTWGMTGIPVM